MSVKVEDALKAREDRKKKSIQEKQDKGNSAYEAYKSRKQNNAKTAVSDLASRINQEIEKVQKVTNPSWGSDSLGIALESTRESRLNLEKLTREVESYKNYFDEETYNSLSSVLGQLNGTYDSYLQIAEGRSQYESEEDYKQNYPYAKIEDEINSVRIAPDFTEKSGYVSSKADNLWGKMFSQYDLGYNDLAHEYINNQNGLRDEIKSKYRTYTRDNLFAEGEISYEEKGYDFLKEEEIAVYNYYYNTEGKERAQQFLDSMEETLVKRKADEEYLSLEDNTLKEIFYGIVAGTEQFRSGIENIGHAIVGDKGTTSSSQYVSEKVREDLADKGPKILGSSIGQIGYDLVNTTSNMLPSILVGSATGGLGGAITLGASASGNAYSEMRRLGYNAGQARAYAVLVGASEALLSSVLGGISALGGGSKGVFQTIAGKIIPKLDNALARVAIQIGGNALDEGLEEALQEVLDPIFKMAATGDDFEGIDIENVLYSGLLGILSGGLLEGAPTIAGTAINSHNAKELYGNSQQDIVTEALKYNPENAHAQKMQTKLDKGKNISGYQLNRLVEETDPAKIASATKARLTELGEKGDVSKLAEVLAKQASGESLSLAEKAIIKQSQYGDRVANELNPENISSGEYSTSWAENIGTKRINASSYNKQLYDLARSQAEARQTLEQGAVAKTVADAENAVEGKYTVSEDGKTIYTADGKSEDVNINKIVSTEGGKVKVELDNGKTVDISTLSLSSAEEGIMYEMVARMELAPEAANEFVSTYKPTNAKQAMQYLSGVPLAYQYGKIGYEAGLDNISLTDKEKRIAYNRGRMDAVTEAKSQPKASATKNAKGEVSKGKNGIIYENDFTYNEETASDVQKASMAGIETIAKMSSLEVHVYESYIADNGKRVYKLSSREGSAPNGFFTDGNKIYIDINAGNKGEGAMLYTMSHEVTHYIRKWNAKGFKVLGDFLIEQYGKHGVPVQALLESQKDKIKKRYNEERKTLPSEAKLNDMAYEELVADAMSDMFADPKAYEKLAKLKQKNHTVWQKLGEAIKNLLDKLKSIIGAYKNYTPDAVEAHYVRKFAPDVYEKLQDLYLKAFVEADANYEAERALTDNGIAVNSKTESGSIMSVRDVLNDDDRQKVSKTLAERFGVTQNEAMDWLKAETSLASLILNPKYSQYLDYTADASEEAIKSNSDYPQGTVDFSNICKKRRDFTEVMNRVLRNFPNHVFAATDLAKIRTIMEEEGMEVACAICYVEDRRQLDSVVAQDFIDSLSIYRSGGKTRPDGKPFNANQLKAFKLIEGDTYTPSIYELISLKGRNSLKAKNPAMEEAWVKFNNARGMQSVRLLLNDAEYKRQILKYSDAVVKRKNDFGGLRIYSFSDAEMFHLIDIIQVITDSATVGLSLQGYTKVNEYARAVKDTGEKLNRSLIPKGDLGYHMEDGKVVLDFDTVEGIDINHPDFFDNIDNPNIGNIVIGINATQIKAAMTSKFIDQIIPFHTGQSNEVLSEKGIATWENYKDFQSERDVKTGKKSSHQINIYTEVINAAEAEGHPITNKVDFVNKFLEVCKENDLIPRFSDFLNVDENGNFVYTEGYHKFLVDFKTFDQNTGEYLPQMPVKPIFDNEYITNLLENYVKEQKVKDAKLAKTMPKVLDRITKEIVNTEDVKFSDRDSKTDKLEERDYTVSEIKELFNRWNTDKDIAVLGEKVFAKLDSFIKYQEQKSLKERRYLYQYAELPYTIRFRSTDYIRNRTWVDRGVGVFSDERNSGLYGITYDIDKFKELESDQLRAQVLLHEAIHAVTVRTINEVEGLIPKGVWIGEYEAPNDWTEEQKGAFALMQIFEQVRFDGKQNHYGEKSVQEMVAELSNPEFRQHLKKQSLWARVIDAIKRILGIGTDNALDATSSALERILNDRVTTTDSEIRYSDRDSHGNELSAEQQAFYKDSKARDEDGNLLVLYHGTSTEQRITEFKTTEGWRTGLWLTTDHKTAVEFAKRGPNNDTKLFTKENSSEGSGRHGVYELYANVKNPLIVDAQSHRYYAIPRPSVMGEGGAVSGEEINAFALENGYDGVIIKDVIEGSNRLGTDVIVFSPNQAKYTDNLNPTEGNDISYSDRDFPNNAEDVAKEYFGTTKRWSETGYLLKDGTQLDFSGRHWAKYDEEIDLPESYYTGKRNSEHYEIADAFPEYRDVSDMTHRAEILYNFLKRGNIRIVGKGTVELYAMPSEEQYERLYSYFKENKGHSAYIGIGNIQSGSRDVDGITFNEGTDASIIIEGIRDYFSNNRGIQSDLMRFHTSYSDRDSNSVSNRTLLTNALESVAQNDIEKNKLAQYKQKITLIESEQKKLSEIKAKAQELRFTKGRTPSETKQMRDLEFEATQTANRINTHDKQLLNLESTSALKSVLEREKKMLRKKLEQKGKDAIKAQKEKAAETVRALMTRHQESRQKAIEGRYKTEFRNKIKDVVSDLNKLLLNPTKDQHVPIGLQRVVAEALDAINMDTMNAEERVAYYNDLISKSSDPDEIKMLTKKRDYFEYHDMNFKDRITALKNAYAEFKESEDPLIRNAHNDAIEDLIKNTADEVGNKSLKDMSYEQLEAVYDMYKAIKATVRNANKLFKEGRQETVTENSESVKVQVKEAGGHQERVLKLTKFFKKFGWNMLKPVTAMKVIGSKTFAKLFDNVRAGEDTWAVDVNEAKQFYSEMSAKYGYNKWNFKERFNFKDSRGEDFSISLEQIMSLYAYSKREQADKHLEFGGFIFDDAIEVTEKKLGVPLKYEVNDANPHRLGAIQMMEIIGKLTTEQKGFIDEMQTYLSDVMGAKGNEVSLALYDIKLYKEKNYFPLKTARYFREFDPEKSATPKIKNSGFSKKTVPQAGNPIVLSNFMDVWANHVNNMSMYHAFVLPLEDFMRVYNYSSTAGGYDSVQQYIKNAYGSQANQYIETLMNDLNGGARVDPSADTINKGISLFKKASVFASASVVIQQPSAIARAFAYINPKHFATSAGSALNLVKHKSVWAEIKKYAPVAVIKEMGYFDTGMGRSTVEWIKGNQTIKDKVEDVLAKAPALADELSWSYIWLAVKNEIKSTTDLKVGSEEFLKRCGERFTEVITNTQVYDSVLSRSGMMRSKDTGMKMATAFMAEPTTTVNMMVDGILQGKRGNKKFTASTVGAVSSSIILNSILVALVYAARDDDEDETYAEKYVGSLTTELLDGFNPLTYVPFVKDIWSIAQGYDVERSDMSVVSKLWESIEGMFNEDKSGWEKVLEITGSISSLFGIPLKNIIRDGKGIYNLTETLTSGTPTTDAGIKEAIGDSAKSSIPLWDRLTDSKTNSDRLYDAIMSGDQNQIERIKGRFKDEDAIVSAMRQGLRENDSRIHEAAQAKYDGDIAEYTRIAKEIISEGKFSQDTVVGAINAEVSAIKKGETTEEEPEEEKDRETSIYSASDINAALDNGDTSTALDIIDDLIETKVANGMTEKEAKSSLRSSMTSYWKPLYKKAYESGNSSEMARIRKILYASGLYGNANEVVKSVNAWLKD